MIDLNADLGEGMSDDAAMLALVTSASIACGGHAGDAATMRAAIRGALAHGVRIGAHPGFVDPEHFGRLRLSLPTEDIVAQVRDQIRALTQIASEEGATVAYVKLHGALANMAAEDDALAKALFASMPLDLKLLVLENSAQHRAAVNLNRDWIAEAYADRAYRPDGLLVSRQEEGAVIADPEAVVARCLRLARRGEIQAVDGTILASNARSICLHGDTPHALGLARAVRAALD